METGTPARSTIATETILLPWVDVRRSNESSTEIPVKRFQLTCNVSYNLVVSTTFPSLAPDLLFPFMFANGSPPKNDMSEANGDGTPNACVNVCGTVGGEVLVVISSVDLLVYLVQPVHSVPRNHPQVA